MSTITSSNNGNKQSVTADLERAILEAALNVARLRIGQLHFQNGSWSKVLSMSQLDLEIAGYQNLIESNAKQLVVLRSLTPPSLIVVPDPLAENKKGDSAVT